MSQTEKKAFYPYVLDHKPGMLLSWFLYRLFKRVQLDDNMTEELKRMHRNGTVVYAMKFRGHFDYLLYHFRFRRKRLPYPKISFDMNMSLVLPLLQLFRILNFYLRHLFKHFKFPNPYHSGFFKEALKDGITSLICLVDPKVFYKQFVHEKTDALQFVIETQKDMEKPIFIVPQFVFYTKIPEKERESFLDVVFGSKDNPGLFTKIVLFIRYNRKAFIDFGKPLNLKAYLETQPPDRPIEDITGEVRKTLIENIDSQKRVILGPVMKTRQQIKEIVLKDSQIIKAIEQRAGENPKRIRKFRKKAQGMFDEIAADYNIAYVEFFNRALTWLLKKLFQGIDVNKAELAGLREWARKGPVIYIPSHKSHIDYLVLNYVLYHHNMHVPRIAAGKNLAFWPMGHAFRKAGAFFIRRTFRGSVLYPKIFSRYISALLEEGHPLEFYIEGGRSRSGKLILPKIGFLSILVQAYEEGYCDDLIFIPASIIYDRIMEEQAYLNEVEGGVKEKESLKQILQARRFLKTKYGTIYIRFGEPLSLKEYFGEKEEISKRHQKELAFHLIRSINGATLVTPLSLIASAILTKHRRGFLFLELLETSENLMNFLKMQGVQTARTLDNLENTVRETLSLLINLKVANYFEDVDGEETFYFVEEEKKPKLEYYKNSIIHCFIMHAFAAVSLLKGNEEIKSEGALQDDYTFLKKLFKNEFVFREKSNDEEELKNIIQYFVNNGFITAESMNSGYRLTRLGLDKLPIWAGLAKTYLEAYWIATRAILLRERKSKGKGDILKYMTYLGHRFHKLGMIEHREAISQINFKNAVESFHKEFSQINKESEEERAQARERLSQLGQRLFELSHYNA